MPCLSGGPFSRGRVEEKEAEGSRSSVTPHLSDRACVTDSLWPACLGDVLIYLVRLSDKLGLDPLEEARRKLELNRTKYPPDKVRGSAKKYTDYNN